MGKGLRVSKKQDHRYAEPTDPWELHAWLEKRARRGGVYKRLENDGLVDDLIAKRISQPTVAEQYGVTRQAVYFAMCGHRADRLAKDLSKAVNEGREKAPLVGWVDIYTASDEDIEHIADEFAKWRARHFLTPARTPYITTHFHRRWIIETLRHIRDGRNLLILSPPRHGKTELMIHFNIFFITRVNSNIALVRVCKSEGLAKKALSSVMDHLENNEELIRENRRIGVLGPGDEYRPQLRSGKPWNASEFTVATRDIVGLKSPTMAAVGAGGTLLSRDGDVFIVDDIEDQQTVFTADMREKRRIWFATDLMSRKEEHTSIIYIGSRQHPDDIPGHLLDNPEWTVIVETAHDEGACEIEDPDHADNWDRHTDCVLWPEVRSYRWLMSIKYDPQRASSYPMIYLNHPTDEDVDIFSRSVIDRVLDTSRITHLEPQYAKLNYPADFYDDMGIHHPIRLIAGLDPSGTGYQASFLWAVDLAAWKLYAVDFENRLGGGLHRGRDVIRRWFMVYGVRHWVIEENLYHGAFIKDEELRAIASQHSITIRPHETGSNKWDQSMGVGAIASMMHDDKVSIPWGNVETQAKWKLYRSQLINFSRDKTVKRGSKATKTDIVMASWFPLETMQRWRKEWIAEKVQEQANQSDAYPFDPFTDLYSSIFSQAV